MSRWLRALLVLSAVTVAVVLAIARPGALPRQGTFAQQVVAVADAEPSPTPTITNTPTITPTSEEETHKRKTRTPTPTVTPIPTEEPTKPPPPPPPPPPTATPFGGVGPEIVAPPTGSGPAGSSSPWMTWLLAGAAGAAAAAGGLHLRLARGGRRSGGV